MMMMTIFKAFLLTWGFSGPKANFKIKIFWIVVPTVVA